MKKLHGQLKKVSKELAKLTEQVDRIAGQVEKTDSTKKQTAKTAAEKLKPAMEKAQEKKISEKVVDTASTLLEAVYDIVKRSKNGVAVATLKAKTSLGPRQLSNALYKLKRRGKIQAQSRGLYVKK